MYEALSNPWGNPDDKVSVYYGHDITTGIYLDCPMLTQVPQTSVVIINCLVKIISAQSSTRELRARDQQRPSIMVLPRRDLRCVIRMISFDSS